MNGKVMTEKLTEGENVTDNQMEKKRGLEMTDKTIKMKDLYKYLSMIYRCDRCGQYFPTWWTTHNQWIHACKLAGWSPEMAHICKQCYEEVVPEPQYYPLDKYMKARHIPAYYKPILENLWSLHPSRTMKQRVNHIKTLRDCGILRVCTDCEKEFITIQNEPICPTCRGIIL